MNIEDPFLIHLMGFQILIKCSLTQNPVAEERLRLGAPAPLGGRESTFDARGVGVYGEKNMIESTGTPLKLTSKMELAAELISRPGVAIILYSEDEPGKYGFFHNLEADCSPAEILTWAAEDLIANMDTIERMEEEK